MPWFAQNLRKNTSIFSPFHSLFIRTVEGCLVEVEDFCRILVDERLEVSVSRVLILSSHLVLG